jgi:uncharacterized protein (TIGR03089 family)
VVTTFADQLAHRLTTDPGRPLVTFYDNNSGERVELSSTTYANWVAKASALLIDELGLERGATVHLDLPCHWLGAVFLGAAWSAGLVVSDEPGPDVVVCGPETVTTWGRQASERTVLATSLLPMGVRFATPLPVGVVDVGVEIWSQPDAFIPWDPPTPDDPAIRARSRVALQRDLPDLGSQRAELSTTTGARLLTTANPVLEPAILTEALWKDGSVVLVVAGDREQVTAIGDAERATVRHLPRNPESGA